MKYLSGGAFRRALEDRLRTISLQEGIPLIRFRKMVAFDRFIARLILAQPDHWVIKGGLALQLRLGDHARTTKDIDMTLIAHNLVVYPALRTAGALDLGDWFLFLVAQPVDQPTGEFGGARYPVQALLDGRTFENFHVDVGVGDPMIEAADYLNTSPLLEFADLAPTCVPCFPLSQQIAEKLHAYTRPRRTGDPSRVKDFVDILLIAGLGQMDGEILMHAIQATFAYANTHPLPTSVPPPPRDWARAFEKMAGEGGFKDYSLSQAYSDIQQFLDPILMGKVMGQKWNPVSWSWR
jgi:hypothetical protein